MKKNVTPTPDEKPDALPPTLQEAAQAIRDELIKKAAKGDLDAIRLLRETTEAAKINKLRKELFGV